MTAVLKCGQLHSKNQSLLELQRVVLLIEGVILLLPALQERFEGRNVFFELNVLLRDLIELAFEAAELILLLKAALQRALAVLEKPSLLLGKVGCRDTLLDRGELSLGRVLRSVAFLVSVGEV